MSFIPIVHLFPLLWLYSDNS